MKPKIFKTATESDPDAVYLLKYPDGSEEEIFGVHVREHPREPGVTVLEFAYSGDHGTALKIGRIESETPTSLSFSVIDPPPPMHAGVVTAELRKERGR